MPRSGSSRAARNARIQAARRLARRLRNELGRPADDTELSLIAEAFEEELGRESEDSEQGDEDWLTEASFPVAPGDSSPRLSESTAPSRTTTPPPAPKAKSAPAPTTTSTSSSSSGTTGSGATVDHRGNRLPAAATERKYYALVQTPADGPEPGVYYCTWNQLVDICGGTLPSTGFSYRKGPAKDEAIQKWRAWGHTRAPPEFQL